MVPVEVLEARWPSRQGLTASLAPHAHFPQRLPAYLNLLEKKLVWGEHQQKQRQEQQQQHNRPTLTFPERPPILS